VSQYTHERESFHAPLPIIAPPAPKNWADIVRIEPRLTRLMDSARRDGNRTRRNAHAFYSTYGDYKRRLATVVGWHAADPRLKTSAAYDIAIRRLVQAMGF